jgi:hypothetical protein
MITHYTVQEPGLCWEKKTQYCINSVPNPICQEVTVKLYDWELCSEPEHA